MSEKHLYLNAAQELHNNPGQWQAYESAGHCVVLAGPGSGKTKTLTIKLARILSEDVGEPRGVACITFNNQCAQELEQRLSALGITSGERVFIGTVHSFSLTQIILPYAEVAGLDLPENYVVANQQEQRKAFELALDRAIGRGANPVDWRLRLDQYRRSFLDRNNDGFFERDPECARLVVAYEHELRNRGFIDFDDMPLLALRALRDNKWLRFAIKAKYPVLVVDEYQDLGKALHQMVQGLCFKTGIRLFAVGDIDQSIYGFTGANPKLLQRLSDREEVTTIRLRLNYRSGSNIVKASQYALGENRGYEALEGANEGTVHFHPLNDNLEGNANYLFKTILAESVTRMPDLRPGDIAILYPAAWVGDRLARAAEEYGFDVIRSDGNAIYPRSSRIMRWLEQCAIWCCGGWQTGTPRFSWIVSEGIRTFNEALRTEESKLSFQRDLLSFLWPRRNSQLDLHTWLYEVQRDVLQHRFEDCRTLTDEYATLNTTINRTAPNENTEGLTLGRFCGYGDEKNRINLTTLHSSKGREFRVVVLFGIDNGRVPRQGANESQQRESRRLFYVGVTRAEEEVHILFSADNPSPFVEELSERLEAPYR